MKIQTILPELSSEAFRAYQKRTGQTQAQAARDLMRRALEQLGYYSVAHNPDRQAATA